MILREGLQGEHSGNREPASRERKFQVKGTETPRPMCFRDPSGMGGGAGEFRGIFSNQAASQEEYGSHPSEVRSY